MAVTTLLAQRQQLVCTVEEPVRRRTTSVMGSLRKKAMATTIQITMSATNGRMRRKRQTVLYPLDGKVLCKQLCRGRWHSRKSSRSLRSGRRKLLPVVEAVIVPQFKARHCGVYGGIIRILIRMRVRGFLKRGKNRLLGKAGMKNGKR